MQSFGPNHLLIVESKVPISLIFLAYLCLDSSHLFILHVNNNWSEVFHTDYMHLGSSHKTSCGKFKKNKIGGD